VLAVEGALQRLFGRDGPRLDQLHQRLVHRDHPSRPSRLNLIVDQREGNFIIYRLNTTILQEWLGWLFEHFGGGDNDEKE
jgi:hypothetical protein